jgi:hypothetical protein
MKFLAGQLKSDEFIYLTTPNFFSRANVSLMAMRRNPQPIFPASYKREETVHFHVREYCMSELLSICSEAGLGVFAFYFSDCWDKGSPGLDSMAEDERKNLVIVAKR